MKWKKKSGNLWKKKIWKHEVEKKNKGGFDQNKIPYSLRGCSV
jgi:hypothetical protein